MWFLLHKSVWTAHVQRRALLVLTALVLIAVTVTQKPVHAGSTATAWAYKGPMLTARTAPGYGVVNGRIYALGGWNAGYLCAYLNTVEVYNPAADVWSPLAAMPTARENLKAGAWSGKLYAVGGSTGCGPLTGANEVYDPVTNTWASLREMPTARTAHGVGVVNGILYAVGGGGNSGKLVEAYDIAANTWSVKASMRVSRTGAAVADLNDRLYVFGGIDYSASTPVNLASAEVYDPAANTWTLLAPMPAARTAVAAVAVNGIIYVIGGNNEQVLASVLAYSPATNSWSDMPPLNSVRTNAGAAAVGNVLYAFGGFTGSPYDPASHLTSLEALGSETAPTEPAPQTGAGTVTFDIPSSGGRWLATTTMPNTMTIGYGRIRANSGQAVPAGLAIFGIRQNNVLISEAAIPAAKLIRSGRIFAEINGPVNTGLAIANPNDQTVSISFVFNDSLAGRNVQSGSTTIPPNGQISAFLNADPFHGPSSLQGTLTFTASAPVAALAIRGLTNQAPRSEFLISTLPVVEVPTSVTEPLYISQFADGNGSKTQLILINPTDSTITGRVRWTDASGNPVAISVTGPFCSTACSGASFTYRIAPASGFQVQTSGLSGTLVSGRIAIEPDAGNAAPAGTAIFAYNTAGFTVTEAGVEAIRARQAFRMYAELSTGIQTALAIASTGSAMTVDLSLTTTAGASTGYTARIAVPANGKTAAFLNDIPGFENVPRPFRGVLRASGPCCFAMVGLRTRYNERNEFLMTTTAPAPEDAGAPSTEMVFPHFAIGGGLQMEFVLFGAGNASASGALSFYTQQGASLSMDLATWQEIESVTQPIQAALGGTIALPGGSTVVIPPGFLKNDQRVTVSLLPAMPRQVPSGLLSSVGPAISITFPRGAANPGQTSALSAERAAANELSPGIQVNIITSSLPTDPDSYVQLAEVEPPQAKVQSNIGMFTALPGSTASATLVPAYLVNFTSQSAEDSSYTVNMGNVTWNRLLPTYPVRYGGRIWDAASRTWLAMDSPTVSLKRGVKTCVLVHGMLSRVEDAFSEGSDCTSRIGTANGCEQVVGFNYDWTKGINDSGASLAAFLDSLATTYGITNAVVEAHSEGGPVAVSGLAQTQSGIQVNNLVTLGSPLTGTTAADKGEQVLAWLAYNTVSSTCPGALKLRQVPDSLAMPLRKAIGMAAPFLRDLTTTSGTSGNLARARDQLNQNHRETAVTAVAGTGGSLLPEWTGTDIRSLWNGWLFDSSQQDSIVNGPSARGENSGLNVKNALTFALEHTALECDERVIRAVGLSVNSGTTTTTRTLTVTKSGAGTGTVASTPTGIACGVTCTGTFQDRVQVTLTATAASGSRFTGWSGSCSGTGSCTLTMDGNKTVTATFEASQTLTYTGSFSASFPSFTEPTLGCIFTSRMSGAITLTLTTSSDGTISGSARIPATVNTTPASSTVPGGSCTSGSSSPVLQGSASGTDQNITGTFSDQSTDRPYTMTFTGRRSGDTVTASSITISRTFQTTNNGSVTGSFPRTVSISNVELRRQ